MEEIQNNPTNLCEDVLAHHGILGMKWGVRRYQNKDGTYTQLGLQHYKHAISNYQRSKSNYKTNRTEVNKTAYKRDKNLLKKAYEQLQNDYIADKGKKLYQKGYRSNGLSWHGAMAKQIALDAGLTATLSQMKVNNKTIIMANALASAFAIYQFATVKKNMQLGAFYAHARNKRTANEIEKVFKEYAKTPVKEVENRAKEEDKK